MTEVRHQTISAEEAGQRLDNYLIKHLKGVPKSYIYRIIRGGEVRVNKKRAAVSYRVEAGDVIRIPPVRMGTQAPPVNVSANLAACLEQAIIYEDNAFLVINKPAGLAVHGGSGLSLGVIEALRQARPNSAYLELVHRLDRDTSGCLLIAKKRSALKAIQAQLVDRDIEKVYWALLCGRWELKSPLVVEASLQKNTLQSGERMVRVDASGKAAETQFRLLENFADFCLAEVQPKTGRTHQIRVHSAHLGHVIVGDSKYGYVAKPDDPIRPENRRLYLHARSIKFKLDDKKHCFTAELDQKFSNTLKQLGLNA